jgi:hypothetical protein
MKKILIAVVLTLVAVFSAPAAHADEGWGGGDRDNHYRSHGHDWDDGGWDSGPFFDPYYGPYYQGPGYLGTGPCYWQGCPYPGGGYYGRYYYGGGCR